MNTMRSLPLFLLALAACNARDYWIPTTEGGGGTTPVAVHGVVTDSVTGMRLPGVAVSMGGVFTATDAEGAFDLTVGSGVNTVHVAADGYEPFARTMTVDPLGNDRFAVDLPLRRLAPFPVTCELGPDGFRANIVDLQGRKSLERWSQSELTLVSPAGPRTIPAITWGYHALDYLVWQVTIPDADPSTSRVDWVLFDSEGDAYRGSCEPVSAPSEAGGP